MIAIELEGVSKRFRLRTIEPATTLKTTVLDWLLRRRPAQRAGALQVLRDITLAVRRGQTFGIIGRNGSGKSTLLKLMAGIYRPETGRIRLRGRVAGLLELGAGFHPEFSGRENVFINGIILGLSKQEIRDRFDDIVRFAELEAFIDEPLRTYSSGMYMRLGFSVAVHANPDILLIDEILSVGDEAFQAKCAERIQELQRKGKTLVLVSHDLGAVARWCDEAVWLDQGMIRDQGDPPKVIDSYRRALTGAAPPRDTMLAPTLAAVQEEQERRRGSGEVEIVEVRLLDRERRPRSLYGSGEPMIVGIRYLIHQSVRDVVFGIALRTADNLSLVGTNTQLEGIEPPPLRRGGIVEVVLDLLPLAAGSYAMDVAVHSSEGQLYDSRILPHAFAVSSGVKSLGPLRIPHRWIFRPEGEGNKGEAERPDGRRL